MKRVADHPDDIAVGPGPRSVRLGLAGLAFLYLFALIKHPPDTSWLRPATFFVEATCLFPKANAFAIEYRVEVYACGRSWEPIDPTPYFTIQPDDKESRLQRLGYFYADRGSHDEKREVMRALDDYISARHAEGVDDGVSGPIGGIHLMKIVRPFPEVGGDVERYHFDPFAPVPKEQRRDTYYSTPSSERKRRCAK